MKTYRSTFVGFLIIFLTLALVSYSSGQCKGFSCPKRNLFIIEAHGKCGYINDQGNKVIPPKYEVCGEFVEDRAWVGVSGKFGAIDEKGNFIVIPRSFGSEKIYIADFQEGLATICDWADLENQRCGVIDIKGNLVVPMDFSSISHFSEGLAFVKRGKRGGSTIAKANCEFIDKSGKVVFSIQNQCTPYWSDGLLAVAAIDRSRETSKALWGAVDRSGRFVIPPTYVNEFFFWEGMATVQAEGKGFVIDKAGSVVLKSNPYQIRGRLFSEDLILFWDERTRKAGFMDKMGNVIVRPHFGGGYWYQEGLALMDDGNGRMGYIDRKGKWVIQPRFEWAGHFIGGLAPVVLESLNVGSLMKHPGDAYINQSGKVVWKLPK